MKPKTGEVGAMVPVSKKSVCALCVRCVRPWFVTRIIPQKPRISKLEVGGFPITANYAIFPANYAFYPENDAFQKRRILA